MNTIVGSCPKCGAPIYSPTVWMSILPPPPIYTCNCVASGNSTIISNTTEQK
jgi:hypothetical protein